MARTLASCLVVVTLLAGTARASAQTVPATNGDVDDAHTALQIATMSYMTVTATIGTFVAMNKPTLFGDGGCLQGDPVFGDYGCRGLSALHGLGAVVTLALYSATTAIEFAEYGWPGRHDHDAFFDATSVVHLAGMALLPLLGLISAVPAVFGASPTGGFARTMRTIHLILAYLTAGSYISTAALDLSA